LNTMVAQWLGMTTQQAGQKRLTHSEAGA